MYTGAHTQTHELTTWLLNCKFPEVHLPVPIAWSPSDLTCHLPLHTGSSCLLCALSAAPLPLPTLKPEKFHQGSRGDSSSLGSCSLQHRLLSSQIPQNHLRIPSTAPPWEGRALASLFRIPPTSMLHSFPGQML